MAIDINILARQINPEQTVLVLGAGASIPSGAPTGNDLRDQLGREFGVSSFESYGLADLATIIEARNERYQLVMSIRKRIAPLQPTGGLMTLPRFSWASIFTTNYDDLVEKAYRKHNLPIRVYSSNHDFRGDGIRGEQELSSFMVLLTKM